MFLIQDFRNLFEDMDGSQEARKLLATLIRSTEVEDKY